MAKSLVPQLPFFDTEKFRAGMRESEEALRRFVAATSGPMKPKR